MPVAKPTQRLKYNPREDNILSHPPEDMILCVEVYGLCVEVCAGCNANLLFYTNSSTSIKGNHILDMINYYYEVYGSNKLYIFNLPVSLFEANLLLVNVRCHDDERLKTSMNFNVQQSFCLTQ